MKRKDIIVKNEISELVSLSLNGHEQKILIEGKSRALPVVISLHGGPGTPIPFSVGCRGLFPEFTDKYIMVYWDQLGCGINNYTIDDSFTIDDFVVMTEDLVKEIRNRFPNNKIIIFSTSWGSILSAKLLEKNPNAVDAVIAAGQIIRNVFLCEEVINELEKSKISRKKVSNIRTITVDNYSGRDLQLISTLLRKYTNAYQNKVGAKAPVGQVVKGLLTSPDYKLKDFKAIMINGYMKNNSLWNEILRLDLSEVLGNVKIPYLLLQGDTDIVASTQTAKKLVGDYNNPNLRIEVVGDTGHMPGAEMMKKLMNALDEMHMELEQ